MLECDLPKKTDPFVDFNFTALELLILFETRIAIRAIYSRLLTDLRRLEPLISIPT